MLKTLAHVFAVGNLDSDVNLKEGNGENPSGSSLGIPVANAIMSLSVIEKGVSFTFTSPELDSVGTK